MSKIYKILFLSVSLFFLGNEVWMAQPDNKHPERKIILPSRGQGLFQQDSGDSKQVDEAENLADRFLRMYLSSKQERISIKDFIACVSEMSLLIENREVLSDVESLIDQLQASKHEPEKKIIKIAKELVRKLCEGIAYADILAFIIKNKALSFAQSLFKLGFPCRIAESFSVFEIARQANCMFTPDIKQVEVLNYIKANYNLANCSYLGESEGCFEALEAGAYIDVRKNNEKCFKIPLHQAAENLDEKLIDLFIVAEADVNAQDWFGRIPLYSAIFSLDSRTSQENVDKCKRIVRKLLEAGTIVDRESLDFKAALKKAQEHGFAEIFAEF